MTCRLVPTPAAVDRRRRPARFPIEIRNHPCYPFISYLGRLYHAAPVRRPDASRRRWRPCAPRRADAGLDADVQLHPHRLDADLLHPGRLPAAAGRHTLWCTAGDCSATRPGLGVPFGPFALWNDATSRKAPRSRSRRARTTRRPENVVRLIASARAAGQKLILVLTGGAPKQYSTNGAFDLSEVGGAHRSVQHGADPRRDRRRAWPTAPCSATRSWTSRSTRTGAAP